MDTRHIAAPWLILLLSMQTVVALGESGHPASSELSTQAFPWQSEPFVHTYTLTSTADDGPGTLREAITQANAEPGLDLIVFDSTDDHFLEPRTIFLGTPLPTISDSLVIDGYIDKMLWKPSGITLNGQQRHRLISIAENTFAKIANLTLTQGNAENGGAILNRGTTVLSGMLLIENAASISGGAVLNEGSLYLINSTLAGNSAEISGGALYHSGDYLKVTHATFDANQSSKGGAIYSSGPTLIQNSILANSLATFDCYAEQNTLEESSANIIESSSGCGGILTNVDPRLGELGGYNGPTRTIPVNSGSPAFNRANNALSIDETGAPLVWDQRGNGDPRYAVGIADIGAFEAQPQVKFEVDTLSDEDIRGCTRVPNDCSLRGALQLANHSERHNTLTFDSEVFGTGAEIDILTPLPVVERALRIDAGNVDTVILRGKTGLSTKGDITLETINIEQR